MQQSDSLADGYTSRPSSGSPAVSTMVSARQQGLMAVESEARGAGTAIGIAANASTSSRQQRRRGGGFDGQVGLFTKEEVGALDLVLLRTVTVL